jgi:galactokinase/mevalonate kinase-like predicted kinase
LAGVPPPPPAAGGGGEDVEKYLNIFGKMLVNIFATKCWQHFFNKNFDLTFQEKMLVNIFLFKMFKIFVVMQASRNNIIKV